MRFSGWSSDVCSSDLGCTYGDFQFTVDAASDDFLDLGILSCYRPVAGTPDAAPRRSLDARDFSRLLALAHVEPGRAFSEYAAFYLATNGQRYASDEQQARSEEHTSELQSLMRTSYAVFCLKKKK